jgi:PKD repeat protein
MHAYLYAPVCNNEVTEWTIQTNATFLTIDQSTGVVSGTPELGSAGSYNVTIRAMSDPECNQTFILAISAYTWNQEVAVSSTVSGLKVTVSCALSDPSQAWAVANVTWDFGDGSAPIVGSTASHTYAKAGTYTITVTVQAFTDETSEATKGVTVVKKAQAPTIIDGGNEGGSSSSGPDTSAYWVLAIVVVVVIVLIGAVFVASTGKERRKR